MNEKPHVREMNGQRGFTVIEFVLAALIVCAIAAAGYYGYGASRNAFGGASASNPTKFADINRAVSLVNPIQFGSVVSQHEGMVQDGELTSPHDQFYITFNSQSESATQKIKDIKQTLSKQQFQNWEPDSQSDANGYTGVSTNWRKQINGVDVNLQVIDEGPATQANLSLLGISATPSPSDNVLFFDWSTN